MIPRQPLSQSSIPTAKAGGPTQEQLTVMDVCDLYIGWLEGKGAKRARGCRWILQKFIYPSQIAHLRASELNAGDIMNVLRDVLSLASESTCRTVRSVMHAAYNHVIRAQFDRRVVPQVPRHEIAFNPVTAIPILGRDHVRSRWLNNNELYYFWSLLNATGQLCPDVRIRALRVDILLGGQLCDQLLNVALGDVDLNAGTITLHNQRARWDRSHVLPLAPCAKVEVAWLVNRAISMGSEFLFASKQKNKALQASSVSHFTTQISRYLVEKKLVASPFQFRDIRRTTETGLASLGVQRDVRARILNHHLDGHETRFDHWDDTPSRRDALKLWEKHLNCLLSSSPRANGAPPVAGWLDDWKQ